jgi:hypothetical protein
MWLFKQSTGQIFHDGTLITKGYAGRDYDDTGKFVGGKNNPVMQNVKGIGPLPVGFYTMQQPHDSDVVGKYAIPLIPDATNEMFNRASFFWHGDKIKAPGTASHGCIVSDPKTRVSAWTSGDHRVQVVI